MSSDTRGSTAPGIGDTSKQLAEQTGQGGASAVAASGDREGAETATALSKDAIFKLLRNSRRRSVLRFLDEWNGQGSTGQLAEHLAAEEEDVTVRELTSKQRKRVYIALLQYHLPKLADYGVVNYDQARGTVELTEAADELFPYLELGQECPADSTGYTRIRSIGAAISSWLMPWR